MNELQRQQNLLESDSRRRLFTCLSPKPRKKPRHNRQYQTPSKEEIVEFSRKHIDNFQKHRNKSDFIDAMMMCVKKPDATIWELKVAPMFFACAVMQIDIFSFAQTSWNKESPFINQSVLQATGWKMPNTTTIDNFTRELLGKCYQIIKSEWEKKVLKIRQDNMYEGLQVVNLPNCPTEKDLWDSMLFWRKHLFKLWITTPRAQSTDVRLAVLEDAIKHLSHARTDTEFKNEVDKLARRNLRLFMEEAGFSNHPRYEELANPTQSQKKKKAGESKLKASANKLFDGSGMPPIQTKLTDHKPGQRTRLHRLCKKRLPTAATKLESVTLAKASPPPPARKDKDSKPAAEDSKPAAKAKKDRVGALIGVKSEDFTKEQRDMIKHHEAMRSRLLARGDNTMVTLCQMWMEECQKNQQFTCYAAALSGVFRADDEQATAADTWASHHDNTVATKGPDWACPKPFKPDVGAGADYSKPGPRFLQPANDCMHLMNTSLNAMANYGQAPARFYWKELLMEELAKDDTHHGPVTKEQRDLAMLVCLIESAVTPDRNCILATAKLRRAGLLNAESLKNAAVEDISECIKIAGIHKVGGSRLKELGRILVDEHGGNLPTTMDGIVSLPGVGEKAANVFLAEIFGLFEGIAVDRHVYKVAKCLGWLQEPAWLKSQSPDFAERSLRTWVCIGDFPKVNTILGSMAQLWTSKYKHVGKDDINDLRNVMRALGDHLWKIYHVELYWFIVARMRRHYLSKEE